MVNEKSNKIHLKTMAKKCQEKGVLKKERIFVL
jgi:hypothetical protein